MSDKNTAEKVERLKVETITTFCWIAFSLKVAAENIKSRKFSRLVAIHLNRSDSLSSPALLCKIEFFGVSFSKVLTGLWRVHNN